MDKIPSSSNALKTPHCGGYSRASGAFIDILFLLLLSHSVVFSQDRLSFDNITHREGLSNPSVLSICQDAYGAIWFATDAGVERYDGYGFRKFDLGMTLGLAVDDRGYVWISVSHAGLFCYDMRRDTMISIAETLTDPGKDLHRRASSLYLDNDGILWMALNVGLARFDTKTRTYLCDSEPSLRDFEIKAIADDHAGNLWLGSCCKLARFNKSTGQVTIFNHDISETASVRMNFAPDGKLWLTGRGLVCFDTSRHKWTEIPVNGQYTAASNVMLGDDGRIWVATGTHGLFIYDPSTSKWDAYHHRSSDPHSLSSDRIACIFRDKAGNIWLGTRSGVSKYARWRKQFCAIPSNTEDPNSPPRVPIRSLSEDRSGNIWIGSLGDGLKVWDRRNRTFKAINGIGSNVHAVLADRSGSVWIGTENPDCITVLNPSNGQTKILRYDSTNSNSIPAGAIHTLYEDVDGSIWVGTRRLGIGRIDPRTGRCRRLKPLFDPGNNWLPVKSFYRDRRGALWAIAPNMIVEVFGKADSCRGLRPQGNLFVWQRIVESMYEDREGRFWVGTQGGFGLLDRRTGNLTYRRLDDRIMQNSATFQILEDSHNDFWLMGINSISRFRPAKNEFTDFDYSDGLPPLNLSANVIYGTSTCCCRTHDGFLVYGTGDGIVIFHPDSLHTNPNPPNVILTELKVGGHPWHIGLPSKAAGQTLEFCSLELPYDQNSVSMQFAALDYTNSSANRYAHRLEGLEDSWSTAENTHRAEYINLQPGRYVFRVKAANNDGVWNELGAAMQIIVHPPWWMTWWARTTVVVLGLGVIVLITQLRIRRAVERERLRLQIASDLHDDIGSSLSSIALISENMRNSLGESHPAARDLEAVTSVARQAADRLRDDVWVIKPGSDSLDNLLLRMKDAAQAVIGHIPYTFRADPAGNSRQVPLEFRRNILLIYKEALHNILKHSWATEVEIGVGMSDGDFELDIRDNGRGFDCAGARQGNGLVNMKNRASVLDGDLRIESTANGGTHLHLTVRIP